MHEFIFLGNASQHAAACSGIFSVPTNTTPPLHRCRVPTYFAVTPLVPSIQASLKTNLLVASALTRRAEYHGVFIRGALRATSG